MATGNAVYSLLLLATWAVIGLVVYWARGASRPEGTRWVGIYAVAGPLMLPVMVWQWNARYYREERERKQRQSRNKNLAAPSALPDKAPNPKKLRKKNGGLGPRKH